jgi:hypothetical protein
MTNDYLFISVYLISIIKLYYYPVPIQMYLPIYQFKFRIIIMENYKIVSEIVQTLYVYLNHPCFLFFYVTVQSTI